MYENSGEGDEGFKDYVVQWSAAYYVAYGLLITVAITLLFDCPEPRDISKDVNIIHTRIPSDTLDSVVEMLYVVFASAACFYSAWGLMLSVEWSLRVGSVPAVGISKFLEHLNKEEVRKVYVFNPYHWGWDKKYKLPHSGTMVAQGPAWDPFFFFPHTIDSLFYATFCFLYLHQGALHSIILLTAHGYLKYRVRRFGSIVFEATYSTSQENMWDEMKQVKPSDAESNHQSDLPSERGGTPPLPQDMVESRMPTESPKESPFQSLVPQDNSD